MGQSDCLYLNSLQSYNLRNKIGEMVEFSLKRKWLKLSGTNCTIYFLVPLVVGHRHQDVAPSSQARLGVDENENQLNDTV